MNSIKNNPKLFREAAQNRIFQDVVNQIQDAIIDGRLKAGQVLPPERDLKRMFNTSRGTLREALRVLEERGLIEIRLGVNGGAVVKGISARQATRTLGRMIRSRMVSLNHLAEFREGIEGYVASLAAQRATEDDIARLNRLLKQARGCIESEPAEREVFLELDREFHEELARISGNPVYKFVLDSVHENIHRYYERYLSMSRSELEENYNDMCELVAAIEAGQVNQARLLAQSHVLRFNRRMKEKEETGE